MRLVYVINEDSYFWTHRRHLAHAAQQAGFDVVVATRVGSHADRIRAAGFQLEPLDFQRGAAGAAQDLRTIRQLTKLYARLHPVLVHHVTLKLVLYGSIAARLAGVPNVVNAFAGLGYAFSGDDLRARAIRTVLVPALRAALPARNCRSIFQNREDKALLEALRVVRAEDSVLIRGSGVDLDAFVPHPEPEEPPLFVLPARMLWSKGVGQFVEAARIVRDRGIKARFALVGMRDENSLDAVPLHKLEEWTREGLVRWLGHQEDMASVYRNCHVVTLPTYYGEGLPKVLLEAAACGRAVLATDIAGCREVVQDGRNGILVPPRDVHALANAMIRLANDGDARRAMGAEGRRLVANEHSVQHVAEATVRTYQDLLSDQARRTCPHPPAPAA